MDKLWVEPRCVTCEGVCTEWVLADFRRQQTCSQGCHQFACEWSAEGSVLLWPWQWWISLRLGTRTKMGRVLIGSFYVDLHQSRVVWWTRLHARVFEKEDAIHHGMCQLGLRRGFGRTWVGIRGHFFLDRRRSSGGVGARNRCSWCGTMVISVVYGAMKLQTNWGCQCSLRRKWHDTHASVVVNCHGPGSSVWWRCRRILEQWFQWEMMWQEYLKTLSRFRSKSVRRITSSSSCLPGCREPPSKVEKNNTVSARHDGQKEIGDLGENHSGMCRQWMTQHKVLRTDGIAQTKASGKESLEKYMNGPQPLKKSLTHGMKSCTDIAKRESYSGRDGGQRREGSRWREAQHQRALWTTAQRNKRGRWSSCSCGRNAESSWGGPIQSLLQQNYRYLAGTTSTCGRGTRTVGDHTSSWTKDGRCCRAMTQRPSIWQRISKNLQGGWGQQNPGNIGL